MTARREWDHKACPRDKSTDVGPHRHHRFQTDVGRKDIFGEPEAEKPAGTDLKSADKDINPKENRDF